MFPFEYVIEKRQCEKIPNVTRFIFPPNLQIRYTAFRDRPLQERQAKFLAALREGHTEIVSVNQLE